MLGRATANLIGSSVGGETTAIDGSFLHDQAKRLVLTIDPEIQGASYYLLFNRLRELDNKHPANLKRPRRGAITVINAETGQILAHAGAPGYDPLWQGDRVILANRQSIVENPANGIHMPGSAIKVLTAGMGYLMFGDGSGEMLPASINKLAIRQAFRNVYGGPMPPENIVEDTELADVTADGDSYFNKNAGSREPDAQFVTVLTSAFNVIHYKPDDKNYLSQDDAVRRDLYEPVVLGKLARYFDFSAMYSFFPARSRFPVKDAKNMGLFRQYAIGASESRFTTMRLAAVLHTASTGQPLRPFIVESVLDPEIPSNGNRVSTAPSDVFPDLREGFRGVEGAHNGNDRRMAGEIRRFLEEVCISGSGHTGFYKNVGDDKKIFFTEDNPLTRQIDESQTRRGDFGKTGTADNGKVDPYNDSIFVYKHGNYIIAIWMERADESTTHPANLLMNEVVSFIEKVGSDHP